MKNCESESRFFSRQCSPAENGAALIVVLALVVLLTGLVLAYFSYSILQFQISTASANQSLVGIFAQGAVNTVVSDLRREIIDDNRSEKITTGTNQVYFPKLPEYTVPSRVGTSNALPNLVKRSAYNLPFYTAASAASNGPSRAANLSTTNVSQNQRFLSPSRWNTPLLLPKLNATSVSDLTPVTAFVPPDWILLSRDGSNPTAWNANLRWNATNATTVVGRYAYAIYDEGGLLDVNVAGYPPGSSDALTTDKGSLAYADLTVIPGMTPNVVSSLVGWRNYASSQPAGVFPNFTFDDTAKTKYFNFVRDATSGFKRTANFSLNSGKSDRMFVSRQQLIQFLTKGVAASSSEKADLQNALQYLGTFSRDLEQPSFYPEANFGNPGLAADAKMKRPKNARSPKTDTSSAQRDGGGNDAVDPGTFQQLQDVVNPSLLTVQDTNGLPIMKRRFPLSRLALVKSNPSAADAAIIEKYFGLKWDGPNNRWIYDHGNPSNILKLSQIPSDREPDFFETLKAVINCDALGKQNAGWDSNTSPHNIGGIDCSVNYQIIQIGANLIDQYDEDSFPTRIGFDSAASTHEFYGIENLPYLAGWTAPWYRVKQLTSADILPNSSPKIFQPPAVAPGKNGFPYETWVFYQPILWNPHAPDARPNPPDVPVSFRVVAGGGGLGTTAVKVRPWVATPWWTKPDGSQLTLSGGQSTYPAVGFPAFTTGTFSDAIIDPALNYMTFKTSTGAAGFREPYCLRTKDFPAGSDADVSYAQGKPDTTGWVDGALFDVDKSAGQMIGFFSGKCWTGPVAATPLPANRRAIDPNNCLSSGATTFVSNGSNGLQFLLQYQVAGGPWLTYDMINDVYVATQNTSSVDADSGFTRGFRTCFRVDPRSDRWGLAELNTYPAGTMPGGITAVPNDGLTPPKPVVYLPQAATVSPHSSFSYRMTTSSSGITAPGWKWSLGSGTAAAPLLPLDIGDLMVNLFNNTVNSNVSSTPTTSGIPGGKFFYTDADGVIRRAEGAYFSGNDGLPLFSVASNASITGTGSYNSRPVILNRAFRSIAEMGYTFSGTPWKNIDFFTPESGNAGLLDAFCLNELDNAPTDTTVAGRVNLNTRQSKVLQAIIQGVSKAEGGTLSATEAQKAADALVSWTGADSSDSANLTSGIFRKGPLRNRSELVGKFIYQVAVTPASVYTSISDQQSPVLDSSKSYSGFSSMLTSGTGGVFAAAADASIKRRRESVLRALADSGNVRTWNLLIDVVAQIGRYPGSAKDMNNFLVEGETRVWVHVAMDRYTGKVVSKLVEPVSE